MEIKRELKALVEKKDNKLVAIASSETEDRVGDIVKADGWNLKNFKKNPVLMFAHNYNEAPVGVAKNIRVEGTKLIFEPVFHTLTQLAREVKAMYENEPPIMRAFSVGFIPKEAELREEGNFLGGHIIKSAELLEISAVPVPANQEALLMAIKSLTDNEKNLVEDWVKKECVRGVCPFDEVYDKEVKPYPNEHSCRIKSPDQFEKFARKNCMIKHDDKCIDVILGIKEGKSEIQAMRFKKDIWNEADARDYCKGEGGSFEPAQNEEAGIEKVEEKKPEVDEVPVPPLPDKPIEEEKPKEEIKPEEKPEEKPTDKPEEKPEEVPEKKDEPEKVETIEPEKPEEIDKGLDKEIEEIEKIIEKEGRILSAKNRTLIEDTLNILDKATSALRVLLDESVSHAVGGEGKSYKGRREEVRKPVKDKVMVRALQKIAGDISKTLSEVKRL